VVFAHAENAVTSEAIVDECLISSTSREFKVVEKRWAGALLSLKCCCFVWKPSWKHDHTIWTSPSEEEEKKTFWPFGILSQSFFAPLGVLLVMKTLEDEW